MHFSENYRGDSQIKMQKNEGSEETLYDEFNIDPPEKGYDVALCYVDADFSPVCQLMENVDTLEEANAICVEAHSNVNKHGVFEFREYEGFYKEQGSYAEAVEIKYKSVKKIDEDVEKPAICVIVDKSGVVDEEHVVCFTHWFSVFCADTEL